MWVDYKESGWNTENVGGLYSIGLGWDWSGVKQYRKQDKRDFKLILILGGKRDKLTDLLGNKEMYRPVPWV